MRLLLTSVLAMTVSNSAVGQEASVRAFDACARSDTNFVKVEECLPAATVADRMLQFIATDEMYGADGSRLASRCEELNEGDLIGAWSCANEALKSAERLVELLPTGATVADPMFAGLAKPENRQRIEAVLEAERSKFPQLGMWGMNLYQPLR